MRTIAASVGRNATNRSADVFTIQRLFNFRSTEIGALPVRLDGKPSEELYELIEEFQRQVLNVRRPDGVIDPGKRTIKKLSRLTVVQRASWDSDYIVEWAPKWIKVAGSQLGIHEYRGVKKNNPQVLKYMDSVPRLQKCEMEIKGKMYKCSDVDENSWCGCFVNWCLIQAGYPGHTGQTRLEAARAADWVSYGKPLNGKPKYGCIASLYAKIKGKGRNHVGFYLGEHKGGIVLLGGNQENGGRPGGRVCVSNFTGWDLNGYVWPLLASDDE